MKGWADVLLLLILMILTILLLVMLQNKQSGLEIRISYRQAEIIATNGAYEVLSNSLNATWRQIATDALANASSERFGLPLYLYRYDTTAPLDAKLPDAGAGCGDGNPQICLPDEQLVENKLTYLFSSAEIPVSFKIPVTIGQIEKAIRDVTLTIGARTLGLAADRTTGTAVTGIRISGGNTKIDASIPYEINILTQLKILQTAAFNAVSSANSLGNLRSSGLASVSSDNWPGFRAVVTSALDSGLTNILLGMKNSLQAVTTAAYIDVISKWTFAEHKLKLSYDAEVRLSEGLQGSSLAIVKCIMPDGTVPSALADNEFKYNRFSRAIESGMPDLLEQYVEEPRALLAAIAERNSWKQDNLFANGKTDAAESAFAKVQELLLEFKSDTGLASPETYYEPEYTEWKTNCKFGKHESLLKIPLDREAEDLRIVACFGDKHCSGGQPATALTEDFYNGIDILCRDSEDVFAAESGIVIAVKSDCYSNTNCPNSPQSYAGIGNYVMIQHDCESCGNYYTIYGHLKDVNVAVQETVARGQLIGTAGTSGNTTTPMLHFRVKGEDANQFLNPCLYIGCLPITPKTPEGFENIQMPKPALLTSSNDYTIFLSQKNGFSVTLGDDFCMPSDREYRGSNLGYGFYSTDDPGFGVWPAFSGTVVRIEEDESGCGKSVYVDSEDFVTVYSGILKLNSIDVGSKVGPWLQIGIVFATSTCPNPRLNVVFALPNFKLYEGTDRCGREINCRQGFVSPTTELSCSVKENCAPIEGENLGIPEQYCSAIEWPAVQSADGWLWAWNGRKFSRTPLEFDFKMNDTFDVLDCSQHNSERFKWLNPKDILCNDSKLWTCGSSLAIGADIAITGSSTASAGTVVGTYTCVEKYVYDVPADAPSYTKLVLHNRNIAKFCTEIEKERDYICCEGSGGSMQCPANKWDFVDAELVCEVDACV